MTAEVIDFARQTKFRRERFDQIEPRPARWRVKGALPSQGVGFVVGSTRAGKTFIAVDAALKLAAGASTVWGRRARQCAVAYFAAEDPEGCRARVKAWRRAKHRTSPVPFELIGQAPNLLDEGDAADLRATLAEIAADFADDGHELGVVVFDTLSRCAPGADENSSGDMSRAFAVLAEIAESMGLLVIVVAHFGKAGADRGIRGWSGLDANSDATITVERDADDPDLRTLMFAKVKNGVDGGRLCFRLEQVDLGTIDEDGEPESSCVPAFEGAGEARAKPRKRRSLNNAEQLVLQAIRYVTDHGDTQPVPQSVTDPKHWWKGVTKADVKARAIAAGFASEEEKRNTVNVRFSRAIEGVIASGAARAEGDILWII